MAKLGQGFVDDDLLLKGIQTDDDGNEYADFEGLVSTEDEDLQLDVTDQKGVGWDYFAKHGIFNWEHGNEPKDLVGLPLEVRQNAVFKGRKGTYVKGRLLLKQARGREIYDAMQSYRASGTGRRMGLSIQGRALLRDPLNRRRIIKSLVNKVSFTVQPMNTETCVDLIKSIAASGGGITREQWHDLMEETLGAVLGDNTEALADALFSKALTLS